MSNKNIHLLLEVMLDNDQLKKSKIPKEEVQKIFYSKLKEFIQDENSTKFDNLFELNKHFLKEVTNFIGNKKSQKQTPSNKILSKKISSKEPYTAEDIQTQRQTQFEVELEKRKKEFTTSITVKKPEVPVFAENIQEEKMKEIDTLIAETVAQRNYEIQEIHEKNNKKEMSEEWLKSQDTSLKVEKQKLYDKEDRTQLTNKVHKGKQSKTETHSEPVDTTLSKKISWNENKNEVYYIAQKEASKNSHLNDNKITNSKPIVSSEKIIQRQLNELENKVENIYTILNKVLELLQPPIQKEIVILEETSLLQEHIQMVVNEIPILVEEVKALEKEIVSEELIQNVATETRVVEVPTVVEVPSVTSE